ncbi:maternal effect embryo arrest 22 [Tasmannia lanceolata]|uniref:maternal effect embryo arrest 22 n=1 Tax=Tasmannia lanceolata TaxID=3420 RepID=UPI004064A20F
MAAALGVESEPSKSCCSVLKERFLKLEEKRNALRQAVKLLEHQIEVLQNENLNLKKAYKEEQARTELEREVKERETSIRYVLEQEICKLKASFTSLQKKECLRGQDEDVDGLLSSRVLEGETEIKRLKELLEKERKRGDSNEKKIEAEKRKAAEAWKLVKAEKSKAEGEKRLADIERKKAEEFRLCLETSKIEANEARKKLISERSKLEEANKRAEAEKQKANKEKKRADLETVKADEERKCAEVNMKKALDEQICANHLSQQLEEVRLRNKELQKEIQDIISVRKDKKIQEIISVRKDKKGFSCIGGKRCHPVQSDDNANTENAVNRVLKEQLKLEKKQVRHAKRMTKLEKTRNNLLQQELCLLKQDAIHFSCRLNVLDMCFSQGKATDGLTKIGDSPKLQRYNLSSKGVCDFHCQNEDVLMKTHHKTPDAFHQFCTGPLFPISGGSCTQPISGICSELESLVGGSVRNKSQNSAIHSTSASFSDRQLMGPQGRLASSVATSAKFGEENSIQATTMTKVSGKMTKNRHDEQLGTVAESYEDVGRVSGHIYKKRKIDDALNSVAYLYSEDRKLHLEMEEKLYSLYDILGLKDNMPASIWSESDGNSMPLTNERYLVSKPLNDLASQHYRPTKKRKGAPKLKLVSEPCDRDAEENLTEIMGIKCSGDEQVDAVRTDQFTKNFEMFSGDYMKLLELDNPADEEKFRLAMEMPHSPLPEINFTELGVSDPDDSSHLIQGGLYRGLTIEENSLVPSHTVDVIDVEIDSNWSKIKVSDTSQVLESNAEMGVAKQMPICGTEVPIVLCPGTAGVTLGSTPKYFVVFSNSKDKECISRIFCAIENCVFQSSIFSQTDWVVKEVLLTLAFEQDLLLEDKASVFFSLLLYNFSVVASANSRTLSTEDSLFWSDSFTEQLNRVLSGVETRRLFLELCQRDILFSLIEDFLIGRRVLVYDDVQCEPLAHCNSGRKVFSLDGRKIFISSKTATIEQFVAGGIILASICTAVDHIGFICEASYNILRMCQGDFSWILMVLHLFATICGNKYFSLENYSLIMSSITSVVSILERGDGPVGRVPSASDNCPHFYSCAQCPFAGHANCVEQVILLLLGELQAYDISGIRNQFPKKPILSLAYTGPSPMVRAEENFDDGNVRITHRSLCHFSDIVSLLELIACYKSWDWTYDKLIHPLLKMLESCVSEECSAAILILIGQLGRFSVDSGGYQQKGIKELICTLSMFLDLNTLGRRGLCVQFAAVSALITLLSLDFSELIDNSRKLTVDNSWPGHEIVKKWFSLLSNEQQSLAFSIFRSADVKD